MFLKALVRPGRATREAYLRVVRGQDERYIGWLTFV